jgi:hypothetical protein
VRGVAVTLFALVKNVQNIAGFNCSLLHCVAVQARDVCRSVVGQEPAGWPLAVDFLLPDVKHPGSAEPRLVEQKARSHAGFAQRPCCCNNNGKA